MFKRMITLLGLATVAACGCERDADCLARVARCAACKGESVAADTGALDAIRPNIDEFSLEAKVTARLRWEKSLEGTSITVQTSNAVVELKGTVAGEFQRKRAVELAEDTVGVEKVVNSLTVNKPPS